MIREHYAAVKALLPADMNVYMWNVPNSPQYPYVCLWGDLGNETSGGPDGDSLEDTVGVLMLRVRATYAGLTGDSVLVLCRNVRAALNRERPVVAGRWCSELRQASLMDVQADTDVTIPGFGNPLFAVDEFSFLSDAT